RAEAHSAYLRYHASLLDSFARQLAVQGQLLEMGALPHPPGPPLRFGEGGGEGSVIAQRQTSPPKGSVSRPPLSASERGPGGEVAFLPRPQCLQFAIGKIGDVLGPAYSDIDSFPTRVRLPDEPLMLVDRILSVEGEALSLTKGRVVTEHDVHPGAWYLDHGRIPPCLAVESGQADLFLSGYLGLDFKTRGLAVYRLLDAAVTFHRGLPGPGETIRYDIHIDNFFRQDETYLFRFRFVGSVGGEPLLTMTDGCAGFFTAEELGAGKGVVQTALQLRPRAGVEPDDAAFLPPMQEEAYSE